MELWEGFPLYKDHRLAVPVRCVTPDGGHAIHRFFDTSPISPSGRYLAYFRPPFEDREPQPGDRGRVALVDLATGAETILSDTAGWEMQVGANVQWGAEDTQLFFNDVDTVTWTPYGVVMNPFTMEKRCLEGCVFEVSHDGRYAATTCPVRARFSQPGYGVVIPDGLVPRYREPSGQDGLFITDVTTGRKRLLLSIKNIVESLPGYFTERAYPPGGEFFGFQCKWNEDDSRLLMVLRWVSADGLTKKNHVLTLGRNGGDLHMALPAEQWAKGGHHINWHPDGLHLTMNLNLHGEGLRFVIMNYDGTGLAELVQDVSGSGHPSVHRSEQCLVTDSYTKEYGARPDGTIPIRLVTIPEGRETELVRMATRTPYPQPLRLDPHPAWDRSGRYIVFNGYHGGVRRVYIADVGELTKP